MKRLFTCILVSLIMMSFPVAKSETNETFAVPNESPDMVTGDYFKYALNMDGAWESMEDETIKKVQENSNSGMLFEYAGESCLQTGWVSCEIMVMSYEVNLSITYQEDVGVDNDEGTMTMKYEATSVRSGNNLHGTTVTSINQWFSVDNESYHSEMISTEISISESDDNSEPEMINVGDTWMIEKNVETITNQKSRINGESWEHEDEIVENSTITSNYNAENIANVITTEGEFKTMKIKEMESGSSESSYEYIDENGLPVKLEYYEDSKLVMIATLSDYSLTNEAADIEEKDNSLLPGFTLVMTSIALVASFILTYRKN